MPPSRRRPRQCCKPGRQTLAYRFRSFTHADLSMVALWLNTPEVVRWWGDPKKQLALLTGDLDEPRMRQWIVGYDGVPFAYVQSYPVDVWPQPHLAALPAGAVGVDAFIGVPEMIGRGHGGAFLRDLAQMLIAEGAPAVAIDPDVANLRARRAYARAGFVGTGEVDTDAGRVAVMLYRKTQPLQRGKSVLPLPGTNKEPEHGRR